MNSKLINYFLYFAVPLLLSLIFTPVVRKIAIKSGQISYPRTDRWHKQPTALLGGISIYLSAVFGAIFLGLTDKIFFSIFLGSTFLFIIGLIDDKVHFAPYTKLFAQLIAGSIVIFFGIVLGLPKNIALLSIPITLLWIVGVTNSFNLLDNIDGLAVGIASISSLMLFFSSLLVSNNPLGILGLVLSGAALGFLPYNFNPAKIFMGDSGSMFLGYSLAVISVAGTTRHISNLLISMLIPVLILTVPIFDTIFVMIARTLQGKQIFVGGKDHTSHRLVTLGISQRKTVLLLYALSIAFSSIALFYSKSNIFVFSIIAFLAVVILLIFGLFISEFTSHNDKYKNNYEKQKMKNEKTVLNAIFLHKRRVVEILLDLAFICISYYCAFFLRFEGSPLFKSNTYLIGESLGWIILIKMSVFFFFGLYRGIWRYVGISDLLTIFKVVSMGSVISVLFLTFFFRFRDYSRVVFFIDWLLLLFLVSGARILFRVLGEFINRLQEKGKNILIFGAGDTGEMVLREIKRNKVLNYNPIGFIDDDPSKIGNKIHGVPVLGSRSEIRDLVSDYNVQEIIIAVSSLDPESFFEITDICKNYGIAYRKIKGILDREEANNIE